MRFDLILFDADGTLWDFERSSGECLRTLMQENGLPATDEVYLEYRRINDAYWRQYEQGLAKKPDFLLKRFEDLLFYLGADGDADALNEEYKKRLSESCYLIDGAAEVAKKLSKRLPLYIVTNGTSAAQHGRHEKSGLKPYFKDMFISDDLGAAKPDPRFFDAVFSRLPPVDRSRVLLCGDLIRSDMKGGENAGLVNCWYNPRGAENQTGIRIDYEIQSLKQLIHIVE